MPREKFELASRMMDAVTRRDLQSLIAFTAPEVEIHSFFAGLAEGGVYRGHEGLQRWLSDLTDAFEIVRADVDDGLEVGDVVVLVGRIHYRGKASGVETAAPAGWTFQFRRGKVRCWRAFREPEQALGALGLRDVGSR